MRKDCGIAAGIVAEQTPEATLIPQVYTLVQAAEAARGGGADYTEIALYLESRNTRGLELRTPTPP